MEIERHGLNIGRLVWERQMRSIQVTWPYNYSAIRSVFDVGWDSAAVEVLERAPIGAEVCAKMALQVSEELKLLSAHKLRRSQDDPFHTLKLSLVNVSIFYVILLEKSLHKINKVELAS